MKQILPFLFITALLSCASQKPKKKDDATLEIMFYNMENFFDTIDDPETRDEAYLPDAPNRWNTNKYNTKLVNISKVITTIDNGNFPDLIGVCEIENRSVLQDLSQTLGNVNYKISHFESPDHRGIDVGLLYKDSLFSIILEKPIYVNLKVPESTSGKKGKGSTRNILKTVLAGKNDTFCIYVCHFPSRREGKSASEYKRLIAANRLRDDIDQQKKQYPRNKIIVMGDFNDEPVDLSINKVLEAKSTDDQSAFLLNLFYQLDLEQEGSYRYRSKMNMLDQIIISDNLWNPETSSRIFNPSWLIQKGKYAGYPLRTFGGKNYLAGYSDHFPVFAQIPLK